MLHYEHRRIPILTCGLAHEHQLFQCEHEMRDVTEAIGIGLAIQQVTKFRKPISPLAPETAYNLVHVYSGTSLALETVPTLVCAAMWLKRIVPYADWTLPANELKRRNDHLPYLIHSALIEVVEAYNKLRLQCGERTGALWYTA
ncbi:MAG: hypothetical protein ACRDIV_13930 [Ktedonobacteraceae bacterium]